jgi:hypothetical protein
MFDLGHTSRTFWIDFVIVWLFLLNDYLGLCGSGSTWCGAQVQWNGVGLSCGPMRVAMHAYKIKTKKLFSEHLYFLHVTVLVWEGLLLGLNNCSNQSYIILEQASYHVYEHRFSLLATAIHTIDILSCWHQSFINDWLAICLWAPHRWWLVK